MDIARIQLLLAVLLAGTSHFDCWREKYNEDEIAGEIVDRLKKSELYPWYALRQETLHFTGDSRYIWNPDVTPLGCWVHTLPKFTLSCSRITINGESLYRAILYDYVDGKTRSVMTWNVLSCSANLLSSISIVRSRPHWFTYYRYYISIIYKEKVCKGYFYNLQREVSGFEWFASQYDPNNINSCPPHYLRTSNNNSGLYKNGWKEVSIPKNPEDCKCVEKRICYA